MNSQSRASYSAIEQLRIPDTTVQVETGTRRSILFGGIPVALFGAACMLGGAALVYVAGPRWESSASSIAEKPDQPALQSVTGKLQGPSTADRDRRHSPLNVSAYIVARAKTTVSAESTGRLTELLVKEGDKVVAGQLLAKLKSDGELTRLRLLQSEMESVSLQSRRYDLEYEQQKRVHRRNEELRSAGMISAAALEQSQQQLAISDNQRSRGSLEVRQAALNQALAKTAYEATFVRAPFAGTVIALNAQLGEIVSPLASSGFIRSGICTIADLKSQVIEFDLGEKYIDDIRVGAQITGSLDAFPDVQFSARVSAIGAEVDRAKGTIRVRAEFDRLNERVRPDMSAHLSIQRKQ